MSCMRVLRRLGRVSIGSLGWVWGRSGREGKGGGNRDGVAYLWLYLSNSRTQSTNKSS